jgi:hypothetical protein
MQVVKPLKNQVMDGAAIGIALILGVLVLIAILAAALGR